MNLGGIRWQRFFITMNKLNRRVDPGGHSSQIVSDWSVDLGSGPNLIRRNWFKALGIKISTTYSLESKTLMCYPELFEDNIGAFTGPPVSIETEDNAKPIFLRVVRTFWT